MKLGEVPENLDVLEKVRKEMLAKNPDSERLEIENARWNGFSIIAEALMESCKERNLEKLAKCTRDLKNRLSRPGVRRQLAELRGENPNHIMDEGCKPKRKRLRLRKENRYLRGMEDDQLREMETRKQNRIDASKPE